MQGRAAGGAEERAVNVKKGGKKKREEGEYRRKRGERGVRVCV